MKKIQACATCWHDNENFRDFCVKCGEVLIPSFASDQEFLEEIEELIEEFAGEPEQLTYMKMLVHAKQLIKRTDHSCPACGTTELLCGFNGSTCGCVAGGDYE